MKNVLFLFWIVSLSSFGRDLQGIKKSGVVVVGTEGTLVPFNYFEEEKLVGFEVELANHLFEKLHLKVKWKTGEFKSLLIGLNSGVYDLTAASHAITEERKAAFDFLIPHYCSGPIVFSLAGGPKKVADLKGKVAAAKIGTIYLSALQKVPEIKEAKSLPSNSELLQALLLKKVDAIVINEFAAEQMIKAKPEFRFQQGERVMQEQLGMAVSKGNLSLRDALNEALKESLVDGSYAKLSQKYFKRNIACP